MRVERIGEATLYTADILEALRSMADESVHCVMTSPPYWGLRLGRRAAFIARRRGTELELEEVQPEGGKA